MRRIGKVFMKEVSLDVVLMGGFDFSMGDREGG